MSTTQPIESTEGCCNGDCSCCPAPAAERIRRREARLGELEAALAEHHAEHRPGIELETARTRAIADLFYLKTRCAFKNTRRGEEATAQGPVA